MLGFVAKDISTNLSMQSKAQRQRNHLQSWRVMTHAFNPNTQEAEAEVQEFNSSLVFKNKKKRKKKREPEEITYEHS